MKAPASGRQRVVLVALGVFVVAGCVIGWLQEEDFPKRLFSALFLLFIGGIFLFSWLHERSVDRLLGSRPPLDAQTFADTYFHDLADGPQAALAVRRLLERYMKRDLGGLRPDDRLDELDAPVDPVFIGDLADELHFAAPPDWPAYRAEIIPLKTMRQLVEYAARRIEREVKESREGCRED